VGDIERAAPFWGALLGQEPSSPRANGHYVTVGALAGTTWLVLQRVPEGKTVKNRVYLDCTVAAVEAALNRLLALGGRTGCEVREGGGISSRLQTLRATLVAWQRMLGHAQGSACQPSPLLLGPDWFSDSTIGAEGPVHTAGETKTAPNPGLEPSSTAGA
jgi:hypothetical protein